MIRTKGLFKSYRNGSIIAPVLKDVDLEVAHGEFLFLVGPSGSGKSTLLSILGCVLAADSGSLDMLGKDIFAMDKRALTRFRRDHLGFVFQRFHLFKGLTALENVRVPLDLRGESKSVSNRTARELLEAVGLEDKIGSQINRLSGGHRTGVSRTTRYRFC
jgi:putative ABC transport system ATP-binding protein